MIKITIFKNHDEQYMGFDCVGHAGYAPAGEDIICAGVSSLVINTVNSMAYFTDAKFTTDSNEDTGKLIVKLNKPADHDTNLLIKSLVLGLQGIQNNYGNDYIILNFKEV